MAAEKSATKMIKASVTMALALFASYELVLATKKESFYFLLSRVILSLFVFAIIL